MCHENWKPICDKENFIPYQKMLGSWFLFLQANILKIKKNNKIKVNGVLHKLWHFLWYMTF